MFCATCLALPGHQSFVAEVIADDSGQWVANGLRFATEAEAKTYAIDLWSRWTAVRKYRVIPSLDPVNK